MMGDERSQTVKLFLPLLSLLLVSLSAARAQTKHDSSSLYPTYEGRIMCGYQGWFRAPEDGSNSGWGHYISRGPFDAEHLHIDVWPDVSEYEKTYATPLLARNGQPARVFSSWDESTVDLHFRWMRDYGIDGAFVQRFFSYVKSPNREKSRAVLEHALKASKKYGRAMAVMYDLSGLAAEGEDCSAITADWKSLVDDLKITSQGKDQTYLYQNGKPLVAIWGLGFPDRAYDLHKIGIEKLIDFLKHDPQYGGCAVMLGVPTYFRELDVDCLPDPYLHEIMASADLVMPWTPQRFTPLLQAEMPRVAAHFQADTAWCAAHQIGYVPCVYPGFSWYNLRRADVGGIHPVNQIPREKGRFYWDQLSTLIGAGAKMIYVAMFDEMDEGTAIFKCANDLPVGPTLVDYEGMPSDHYLCLTGEAGKMLRKEIPLSKEIPVRGEDK